MAIFGTTPQADPRARPPLYYNDGSGRDTYCIESSNSTGVLQNAHVKCYPDGHAVPAFAHGLRSLPNSNLQARTTPNAAFARRPVSGSGMPSQGKKLNPAQQRSLCSRLSAPKYERMSGGHSRNVGRLASARAASSLKQQPLTTSQRELDVINHTRLANATVMADVRSTNSLTPRFMAETSMVTTQALCILAM
eukprot:CAMPEP_0114238946 /NCGR_PEP_ID=MMETSP0058-20121206/8190_1 /TAXON_ID=36894 /ORGANISM="Pyramimonas parkeae, CCMP726" /LENGTH=192 /DNA_ID=CAMNT_0001351079 /DNA_START=374 /DNA_END=953 /DNA_ORIENTATION=+